MIAEIVQQLSGGLLVRMLHTKDGAKIGVTCVMHGNNKVCLCAIFWTIFCVCISFYMACFHHYSCFPLKVSSK